MKVVFRVDSSTDMSSGHIMRCLALASVMKKEKGIDIQFISRKYKGNLNDLVGNNLTFTYGLLSHPILPMTQQISIGFAL